MILHYLDDKELNPLIKVGSWNKNYGTNFTRNFTEAYSELVDSLGNKTLIITTILVGVSASDILFLKHASSIFRQSSNPLYVVYP